MSCVNGVQECNGCGLCFDEPKGKVRCECCDAELYSGDLCYVINDWRYCKNCVDDRFGEYV